VRRLRNPSLQIIVAIALAIGVGVISPDVAMAMKPLGDGFFRLLRMMIAPVIFITVVSGIVSIGDMRRLGRIGLRTLAYFELVSTLALLLGMLMVNLVRPGEGLHIGGFATSEAVTRLSSSAAPPSLSGLLLGIIPASVLSGFVDGNIPQVLLVSVLTGAALAVTRPGGIVAVIAEAQKCVLVILGFIVGLAPVGAFGALAAAIGAAGTGALTHLAALVSLYCVTVLLFVLLVLGSITRMMGLSLWRVLNFFRDELLIVISMVSTEVVLARLLTKLESAGVRADIAGFVLPAGYSFNQDGTALYMSIALGFLAQATDHPLTLVQQGGLLAVMLLTSKGAAGPGGSLVKLAATLQSSPLLPVSGLGLLVGIERPIASAVGVTNVIGNVVATLVIAKWEGGFDPARFGAVVARARDAKIPALVPPP
jgi:aerobic C4-dicarboxylate transport protein